MGEISASNFGLVIAYFLPGFTAFWGISYFSTTLTTWLGKTAAEQPTVAGFFYVTLASIGTGLTVNAIRWLTLERLHHCTGIPYPRWDFARLQTNLAAYEKLVEFYYRYHEFFGNSLIAGSFTYTVWRWHHPGWNLVAADAAALGLAVLFWAASRDTLRKYYSRSERLLAPSDSRHEPRRPSPVTLSQVSPASDPGVSRPELVRAS